MEGSVAVARPRSIGRVGFVGGVLYVVLFVIGTIVLFNGEPNTGSAPEKIIQWYSDSGHRDRVHAGWILITLAVFFLLWFVSALRRSVSRVDPEGILTGVVGTGGGVYAALAFASVAVNEGIRTMSDDTYHHQVFPELIHAADDVGWVMHATGAVALAAMIIAASLAFKWAGAWPSWAGWLGVVVGILSMFSIMFFPQFLFLLWILIVSIVMLRRAPAPATVR